MARWWLIMDFGIRVDMRPLYKWLDEQDAEECGDTAATFLHNGDASELQETLRALAEPIAPGKEYSNRFSSGIRLYLIGRKEDGRLTGTFLIGDRKRAPWEGFAPDDPLDDEDDT